MLAAPLNARFQATVPSHSICGRPRVHLTLPKPCRTLRASNGPASVQGALSATIGAPPLLQDPFYNRVTELDFFNEKFRGEVGFITVLVGPRNCGKSRVLERLDQQYKEEKVGPLFLNIDSRMTPVTSPEEISKTLIEVLTTEKLQDVEKYIGRSRFKSLLSSLNIKIKWSSSLPFFKGDLEAELAKELKKDEANLELTINKFEKLLIALRPLPTKPVIVIDEANELMSWKESDPLQPELKKFLNFLVSISKQRRLAHVVLATSDYFLASWLPQVGMTRDKFEVEVLGDLTEEEAQKFFYGDGDDEGGWPGIINIPSGRRRVPIGAEEQWSAIYERCGGNIGLLKQCVAKARLVGNWDDALEEVVAGSLEDVTQGFTPGVYIVKGGEAPLWTGEQWKRVLERITTALHHTVLVSEIKTKLGDGDDDRGSKVLLSMVKYNLLALRPFSTRARDLPQEVYGDDEEDVRGPVVTLPLPAHVWAAKAMLKKLKGTEAKDSNP